MENLTDNEQRAKAFMFKCIREGLSKSCQSDREFNLPSWYDEQKFKRGQKYYRNNRLGILESNFYGLITLLAEPTSIRVLMATGQSSTSKTSRRRYLSTILHLMTWYECDLRPGSKSWTSLKLVRQMHDRASSLVERKGIGRISQIELGLTTFGFMGLALIRPNCFLFHSNDQCDREGFTHFWAVIMYLLGCDDNFNMCLLPLDVVVIVCQLMMQYFFIPFLQYENSDFQTMTRALLDGMSSFMPNMNYDFQMFKTKYIIGVPGYQYDRDFSMAKICLQITKQDELDEIEKYVNSRMGFNCRMLMENSTMAVENSMNHNVDEKMKLLNSLFDENCNWISLLGDQKCKLLPKKYQYIMGNRKMAQKIYSTTIGWYILELCFSIRLCWMKMFMNFK